MALSTSGLAANARLAPQAIATHAKRVRFISSVLLLEVSVRRRPSNACPDGVAVGSGLCVCRQSYREHEAPRFTTPRRRAPPYPHRQSMSCHKRVGGREDG